MIAVVDYCKGNLRSVQRGLQDTGADAQITDDPAVIAAADAIVLPGVGAFGDASATMLKTGQMQVIRDALAKGVPFLGICLGEHLLFEAGEEGAQGAQAASFPAIEPQDSPASTTLPEGLGIMPGVVRKIPEYDANHKRYKIPHVGWNSIEFDPACNCPLLEGVQPGEFYYFTHSYLAPDSPYTVATVTHSVTFPCVVQKGNTIFGVQFHPEKSSDAGARILRNFVSLATNQRS